MVNGPPEVEREAGHSEAEHHSEDNQEPSPRAVAFCLRRQTCFHRRDKDGKPWRGQWEARSPASRTPLSFKIAVILSGVKDPVSFSLHAPPASAGSYAALR